MAENRHLARRDERRDTPSLYSPFGRFFDEAFWDPFRLFESSLLPSLSEQRQFALPVDVSETDTEVSIEADIPGFDPKDINVDVSGNMLTITGKHEESASSKGKKWHRRERGYSYAEFTRQILLPEYANSAQADCIAKNGMLKITIPKKEDTTPRKLNVKIES